jgi:tRNA(Ile)-lysidine synthase
LNPSGFESAVAAALQNCPAGTICLAAVSGGADSTAMLAALAAFLSPSRLRCLHVEHGIRPAAESRGDAAFVRELCGKLEVPCRIVSIPPGKIAAAAKRKNLGLEAAARLYRRRALLREGRRIEAETGGPVRILTAHTRDDALETALMRVLRGAGPAGLAAMPPCRGRFVRPLLALSRADVLRYLAEKNIPWREDSTNADTRFLRNRIRHRLIPLLNESFPHWRTGLAALAETQSLAAAFIRDEARRLVCWAPINGEGLGGCPPQERGVGRGHVRPGGACPQGGHAASPLMGYADSLGTGGELFFARSAIIREEALFQGIDRLLAGRRIPALVKRSGLRRFSEGRVHAADLGPLRVWRKGGRVLLSLKKNRGSERGFALLIKAPGLYTLEEVTIAVEPCSLGADAAADVFFALLPLVLRPFLKGDCIARSGGKTLNGERDRETGRVLCALDARGTAAFIGGAGLLQKREFPCGEAEKFCKVTVKRSNNNTGGMDVQQSK